MFKPFNLTNKTDKTKILIVDDDPSVLQILKDRLEMNEYDVLTACDGREGLDRAVMFKPDVILLDILMPTMDGLEMLKLLRKDPECDNIAVIIVTARSQTHDIGRAKSYGIEDYIIKPFDISELLEKIQKTCEGRNATLSWPD